MRVENDVNAAALGAFHVLTVDAHHVVIGGGIGRLGDELMQGVLAVIAQ
ncbi:hypothetical protein [Salinibacterium sp. ZJ77]|nr:hypothetical protein [Salinibacterium sp. ZJ77]